MTDHKTGTSPTPEERIHELEKINRRLENKNNKLTRELQRSVESLPNLRQMIEYSSDLIFLINTEMVIKDYNANAAKALGYKRHELYGMKTNDIILTERKQSTDGKSKGIDSSNHAEGDFNTQDNPNEIQTITIEALANASPGDHMTMHCALSKKDDNTFNSEINICCFESGNDNLFVLSARDISDRIKLAEAQSKEHLHKIFLATVTHELRTPINGILGSVSLMDTSHHDTDLLNIIRDSGINLLAKIDQILDYSRLDLKRVPIKKDKFNSRELFKEYIKEIKRP